MYAASLGARTITKKDEGTRVAFALVPSSERGERNDDSPLAPTMIRRVFHVERALAPTLLTLIPNRSSSATRPST